MFYIISGSKVIVILNIYHIYIFNRNVSHICHANWKTVTISCNCFLFFLFLFFFLTNGDANIKEANQSLLIKELCWELLASSAAFVCSGLKV